MTVRKNILQGSFFFEPEEIWSIVSSQAREFIKTLLVVDPQKRPTAKVAQKHPWLTEWAEKDLNEDDKRLNPNVVKALVTFKEFSDMRKLLCEVLSFTLLPDQIKDLRREFEKMDTDGSGEISLTALKEVLISEAGAGSLGSLTEEEVEDIFNAMRVRKSETRIHWHEFIAAGLSQCQVDERNLRLAFDRLDSDHKGYITFENVMDLMGNDGTEESEEAMRRMWGDSMDACNCSHARITYENFLLLMKGQTKETAESEHVMPPPPLTGAPLSQKGLLPVVHEIRSEEGITTDEDEPRKGDTIVLPSGDVVRKKDGSIVQAKPSVKIATPTTPQYTRNELTPQMEAEDLDSPLSMDEDEDMHVGSPTFGGSPFRQNLTPPQSPTRGPSDYITPRANAKPATVVEIGEAIKLPEMDSSPYIRRRSRSVDDRDEEERLRDELDSELTPKFEADARRALLLPEHEQERSKKEIDQIIKDDSRTNLVVNRALYRAHRQMRLSVLEASKRFEEEQTRRATEMLIKQGEDDGKETVAPVGAGLVMRHGLREKVTSEAVKKWLYQNEKKQEALVEKANKRGGRGKRTRKKTISDMSGLLSSMKEDSNEKLQGTLAESVPPAGSPGKHSESEGDLDFSVDVTQGGPIRKATVPGQFRKVQDPFSMGGLYGHASMPPSVPEPPSKK
jgi:Ca2+-binding EF-hand superfamily protein